jgi:translocator protein
MKPRKTLCQQSLLILIAIVPVIAALLIGQRATFSNLDWYAALRKPWFNPPNWIFGPAWTTLYALMAFACWRILRLPPATQNRTFALTLFATQLFLNAAWPWMFFGARDPLLGVMNIVPQLAIVLSTMMAFFALDFLAGVALVPLSLWVAYAMALNTAIWSLN